MDFRVAFLDSGFLGYDASFMLDFIVVALVLVVPLMLFSLYLIKVKKNFVAHRNMQIGLAVVLLAAVILFEIDMQIIHGGWENVVNKNAEAPRRSAEALSQIQTILWIHLVFAISTPFLWAITIWGAIRNFPSPLAPNPYSQTHKKLGWLATIDLVLTSITGLIFYYFAFIA